IKACRPRTPRPATRPLSPTLPILLARRLPQMLHALGRLQIRLAPGRPQTLLALKLPPMLPAKPESALAIRYKVASRVSWTRRSQESEAKSRGLATLLLSRIG